MYLFAFVGAWATLISYMCEYDEGLIQSVVLDDRLKPMVPKFHLSIYPLNLRNTKWRVLYE
jgi:hypothetical protein